MNMSSFDNFSIIYNNENNVENDLGGSVLVSDFWKLCWNLF